MIRYVRFLLLCCLLGWLVACAQEPPSPTAQPTPTPPPDPVASAQAFIDLLAQGDFVAAEAYFDRSMKAALPAELLGGTWQTLEGQLGPFKEQTGTRTEQQDGYNVVLVTCQFERKAIETKVVFDEAGRITGLFFQPVQEPGSQEYSPPAYADPETFEEQETTVGSGQWGLPGTLTLPRGDGPFPAVVLIHGSGPQDRDESIGPNKPFRDLAWGLATQGVAVLRYDKRTLAHQADMAEIETELTVEEETVEDALAAVAWLREAEGVDPGRVFLLGHSLGGMLAPRIASQAPDLAGLIVLAGISRPLEEVILQQTTYLYELDGNLSDAEAQELAELAQQVARVQDPELSLSTPASDLPLGIPAAYWLDLRSYDPAATAAELAQPMLVLQGGRDYQVTSQDFEGWQAALADRQDVTFQLYPDLNHLFMAGQGPGSPAEYELSGHVAAQVVDDVAAWITQQ